MFANGIFWSSPSVFATKVGTWNHSLFFSLATPHAMQNFPDHDQTSTPCPSGGTESQPLTTWEAPTITSYMQIYSTVFSSQRESLWLFKKTCCCVQLLASPQDTNNLRIPTYLAHPVQSTVYSDLLQVGHNGPSGVLSSLISMVPAVLNREATLFHLPLVSAADTVWGQRWSNIRIPESQTYRVGETDSSGPRDAEAALGDNVWGQIKILFLQSTAHTVTR